MTAAVLLDTAVFVPVKLHKKNVMSSKKGIHGKPFLMQRMGG
jgi:hypothetical protein